MTPDEVEAIITQPYSTWPIKVLGFVPNERTLPAPEKVLPSLFHYARQGVSFIHQNYARTDIARNKAALTLLGTDFDFLLMLDNDHKHDPDMLQKLCGWVMLYPEIRVIGGLNFQRRAPYKPAFFNEDEEGHVSVPLTFPDELFTVDVLGTGSILIHRSVFTQIDANCAWFRYEYDGAPNDYWPGEDIYFSHLCKKNGIPMYVDPSCRSPHISEEETTEETFKSWYALHGVEDEQGKIQ